MTTNRIAAAILATVCVAWNPGISRGENFATGNGMVQTCGKFPDVCIGYISGVWEVLTANGSGSDGNGTLYVGQVGSLTEKQFCLPEYATVFQMRDVFMKYLEENPQERHLPALILVLDALVDAFPCD